MRGRSRSPRRSTGARGSPCRVPNEPAGCGSRVLPPGLDILDVLERGAPTPDTPEVRVEHHVVLVVVDIERVRSEALPRRRPRPPRTASKVRPRLPVRALVSSKREAVARVDCPVGHDILSVVHDQEEIGELVTGAVVVQERSHEQRVVLQARVRVVDALVEPARYVRREPRPMHRLGVGARQQVVDGLRETRA